MIADIEVEEMKQVIEFQFINMVPQILFGEGLQMAAYGLSDRGKARQQFVRHLCTAEALPNLLAQSVNVF